MWNEGHRDLHVGADVGLIHAVTRHIAADDATMRAGGWRARVGTGCRSAAGPDRARRIGGLVATVGIAFGMEVVAWSQNLTEDRCRGGAPRQRGRAVGDI